MEVFTKRSALVWLFAIGLGPMCHANPTWRSLDVENTLVVDTSKGRLIIEMRPEVAPASVDRIKMLAREKIYDGLQFHRVIDDFVAQTGNPNNKDHGKTAYPDLAPEMTFKLQRSSGEVWASHAHDAASGFLGSLPFQAVPLSADRQSMLGWGAHCAGVMAMGRDKALDSANSEFYFTLGSARDMDHHYTVVGRVVVGMDVLLALKQGVPPVDPDVVQSVRLLADLPVAERPRVSIMTGAALRSLIDEVRREKAADFSVCDVVVPVRVE